MPAAEGAGAAAGVLLTSFASKAPSIDFETTSEFELDVVDRPPAEAAK